MQKEFFSSFIRLNKILNSDQKKSGIVIVFLSFLNSIFDVFGIAVFIPLINIILREDSINNNSYLSYSYEILEFENRFNFLVFICFSVFVIIILKNVVSLIISRYTARYGYSLFESLSAQLFILKYRLGFIKLKEQNSNKTVWDINTLPAHFVNYVVLPVFSLINEFIVLVIILTGIILYDVKIIGLLVFVVLPPFIIFYRFARNRIQSLNEELSLMNPVLSANTQQSIFGYADVMITRTKEYFFGKHTEMLKRIKEIQTQLFVYKLAPTKIVETFIIFGVMVLIIYGSVSFEDKEALINLIGVFMVAAYRILPLINRVMVALLSIKSYQYTFGYLDGLLTANFDVNDSSSETKNNKELIFEKELKLRNIEFSYDSNHLDPVLRGIDINVKKGETIGVVGKSGSGKTTLINLLLGFLTPTNGKLEIDDIELDGGNVDSWRKLIGYVQQDVFILEGTLKENIAFGVDSNQIDESKIMEAIKYSSLSELVDSLPNGINSEIGERGGKISGGQKQRIGIARALYSGAKVFIFDEATSALDNETEREITDSIYCLNQSNQFTLIIIAHRFTTLKGCDRIYELEKGIINNILSYDELIKTHHE